MEQSFLKALTASFREYNKFGARSNKKLFPIHKWFGDILADELGAKYSVTGLGRGKESKVEGKYYSKNIDICISKDGKAITVVSFKFVTSNYKQNSVNYFENLLGETANIRRTGLGFGHFLVLMGHTPYLDKNKGNLRGTQKKLEVLNEHNLMKYLKLFADQDFPHKPDVLGIAIVDFSMKRAGFIELNSLKLGPQTQNILNNDLSLKNFIEKIVSLAKFKS